MRCVDLLRKIRADRRAFGAQAHGHRNRHFPLEMGDTKGAIVSAHPPPHWIVGLNSLFRELGTAWFREETWRDHADTVLDLRRAVLDRLRELERGLIAYFRVNEPFQLVDEHVDREVWSATKDALKTRTLLPRAAVDEWGFVGETVARDGPMPPEVATPVAFALQGSRPYTEALQAYTSSVSNFLGQATKALQFLVHPGF